MSYLKSRSDVPLVAATLGELLDDSAAKCPDHEAYVFRHLGVGMKLAEVKEELPIIPIYFWRSYKGMIADMLKKVKVKLLLIEKRSASEGYPESIPSLKKLFPELMLATTKALTIESNAFYNWEELQNMGTDENAKQRKVLVTPTDLTEDSTSVIIPVLTGSQTVVFAISWLDEIVPALLEERYESIYFTYVKTLHDLVNDSSVQECDMRFLKDGTTTAHIRSN
uniref:Uncharacterized protein n=1 Tax=Branchiostoma floridae TaxID=7739 RepID=C3ZLB4_BRAFL|eukprot:XP_002590785.1 hypothetical protein BRAFLDRAFT_78200 [Branchiostoma floridae]